MAAHVSVIPALEAEDTTEKNNNTKINFKILNVFIVTLFPSSFSSYIDNGATHKSCLL